MDLKFSLADRSFRAASNIRVHGAIGFTAETDAHSYLSARTSLSS